MRMMFAALVLAMAVATPALAAHERLFDTGLASAPQHVYVNVTFVKTITLAVVTGGYSVFLSISDTSVIAIFGPFTTLDEAQAVADLWRARVEDAR